MPGGSAMKRWYNNLIVCFPLLILCFSILPAPVVSKPAANFSPTLLSLSASDVVVYEFDGTSLDIPFTLSGTPAGLVFCVFTKDRGNNIGEVTNGFLGWHHVNRIDTCVYYSPLRNFSPGQNTVTWDGTDQDGNVVPADNYTYYLWAFDNQSAKQNVMESWYPRGCNMFVELDESGLPYSNPIYHRQFQRWRVGNDPLDGSLLEETYGTIPDGWRAWGDFAIDPSDHDMFYVHVTNQDQGTGAILKYKWIPYGDAELQTGFGDGGYSQIVVNPQDNEPGVATDGQYLYTADNNHHAAEPDADFFIYDYNGALVAQVDLTSWWSSPEAYDAGAQMNGGPNDIMQRNGMIFLNAHSSCIVQMVDPIRYLESGYTDDFYAWTNRNGDYVLDHNFEEDADRPWVCNDYNVGPYTYTISGDGNLFSIVNAYDVGAVTFGLLAPDGTGLGYMAFAGETAGWKRGELFLDGGTAYDGIYCDNMQTGGTHYEWDAEKADGATYFLGHDSIRGTITADTSPYVSLLSLDGGQTLISGNSYSIEWSSYSVQNIKIDYSADNGATWNTITSSTSASAGAYDWTAPAISSDACKVRLIDAGTGSVMDWSSSTFTIQSSMVKLTSPNGGEKLLAGNTHAITWQSSNVSTIKIEYSQDSGSSWSTVTANVSAASGSYSWTVPAVSSTNCLVRITNTADAGVTDTSDSAFTIEQQSIRVTYPNGGESWYGKNYETITWTSSNVERVNIFISDSGGYDWWEIGWVDAADGSYKWLVQNDVNSSQCLIKIHDESNATIFDQSDGKFSITPSAATPFSPTLLEVTGSELVEYDFNGTDVPISFTLEGASAGVVLSVYTKDGADAVSNVVNGFLGWHHVNRVDTCVYYSAPGNYLPGQNTVTWDGRDNDGGVVPPGEYSYYLWAFDNQGGKQKMSEFLNNGWGWDYNTEIQEVDEAIPGTIPYPSFRISNLRRTGDGAGRPAWNRRIYQGCI